MKVSLLPTLTLLAILAFTSCTQEALEPRTVNLISPSGYVLAPDTETLHSKVIGELQDQFGLQDASLVETKIKEHDDYVLALIEFVTAEGEDGNMLFIIHRNGPEDRAWTDASKYSTLACSGSLGCKLEVYEDEEELAYNCTAEACAVSEKAI